MKKQVLTSILMTLFIGLMTSSQAQYLFPPSDVITFPQLSLIDDPDTPLPEIVFFPQASSVAPNVFSITSGYWNNPNTWNCGCVPNQANDVEILAGHEVVIVESSSVNNLTIFEDAILSVSAETELNISVTGDWTNNGDFQAEMSRVSFNGNAAQSVSGATTFSTLRCVNPTELHILSRVDVMNVLFVNATNLITNDRLSLNFNGTNSAQIAPILEGQISGQITYESKISASLAGWLNIGAPVSDATLVEWNDDFITTGFEGSDYPNYSFVNVQQYLESADSDPASYTVAVSTDDAINPGQGYYMYVNTGTYIFDVKGTPNQGEFDFSMSYTDNDDQINDGLNLLANPYPATINWESTTGWDKTNVYDALYIWDVNEKQFRTYINGYGVNGGSPEIKSTETFWVQAFDNDPTITINETAKDINFDTSANEEENYLSIRFTNGTDNDEVMVVFDNNASSEFDPGRDALKFKSPSSGINVGTQSTDGTLLAINSTTLGDNYNIPISVDFLSEGPYSMIIEHMPNGDESFCIGLEDTESGIIQMISEGQVIDFTSPAVENLLRFNILVGQPIAATATSAVCYGEASGTFTTEGIGDGPFDYFFTNDEGMNIGTFENITGPQTLEGLPAGTYMVQVDGNYLCDGLHAEVEITQSTPFSFESGITALECGETETGRIMSVPEGGETPYQYFINGESTPQLTEGLSADTYLVSVVDALGCEASEMVEVTGAANVEANFTSSSQLEILEDGAANFQFTNNTTGADYHMWDFGDGLGTIGTDVSHSYSAPGFYLVTLSSSNEECDDEFSLVVQVEMGADGLLEQAFDDVSIAYMNNTIVVNLGETNTLLKQISVYNHLGQLVDAETGAFDSQSTLSFNGVPGMYVITLDFGSVIKHYKVVKN